MKFKFQNGVAHLKSAAARFQSPKSGKIELNYEATIYPQIGIMFQSPKSGKIELNFNF